MVMSRAEGAASALGSARLSCQVTWMLPDGAPSWRQGGPPRPVNHAQDIGERGSWDGDLRQLKGDLAAMAYDLRAFLHQLLVKRVQ